MAIFWCSQHQRTRRARAVEVWAGCASGYEASAGPLSQAMEGRDSLMDLRHPVTSWTSLATTQRLIFQVYSRARSWPTRPAPDVPPAPAPQRPRPPGQRLASGHSTSTPGQRLACPGGGGVPVVPVHPTPAPGERPNTSAGQITAPLLQGERPRCFSNTSTGKLGQRLACPWWRCGRGARASNASTWRAATAPGPGHQATRPAPGERPSA